MAPPPLQVLVKAGLTQAQAEKIIDRFGQVYISPLEQLNVSERLSDIYAVFQKFGKSRESVNNRLAATPPLFTNSPAKIEERIHQNASHFGISPEKWVEMAWPNPTLFVRNTKTIDTILTEQATLLGVKKEQWLKKAFQKPAVLSITEERIKQNIEANATQFGVSLEQWKEIAAKEPELLYANPQTLLQKAKENAVTFETDITTLCLCLKKAPSFFYMDPKQTRKKVQFLTNMYLKDLFQMKDNGVKNPKLLKEYLLNNPSYIKSITSIHRRCTYARYLKNSGKETGLAPVWKTNTAIDEEMANAPKDFFQKECSSQSTPFQKRLKQRD